MNCPSPIVFDNDGQIIDSLFGPGAEGCWVSQDLIYLIPSRNLILTGSSVINGTFFTAEEEQRRLTIDPNDTNALLLEGVLVDEIGHFSASATARSTAIRSVEPFSTKAWQRPTSGEGA